MENFGASPRYLNNVSYSKHSTLNTLDICIPSDSSTDDKGKVWVIFIHGGAWRDPDITSSSFTATQRHVLGSPALPHIAGLASLNYRLSPHPDHPSEPNDPARSATHPDHISDILDALHYLQTTYKFSDRYILAGHSCGATLALQAAISRSWDASGPCKPSGPNWGVGAAMSVCFSTIFGMIIGPAGLATGLAYGIAFLNQSQHADAKKRVAVVSPLCVVGIEGLYDLPALVAAHADQPVYEELVKGAFGEQAVDGKDVWKNVSPATADFTSGWINGKLVVLAHSREDELVEWEQVELMARGLEEQGWKEQGEKKLVRMQINGTHDGVWQDGREVARVIERAVQETVRL